MYDTDRQDEQLIDKVVHINRVSKVVKGGKRFRFSTLVVVGDGNGSVGHAIGKGKEVTVSIRKGVEKAKKAMVKIPLVEGTLPHEIIGEYGAGKVLLKPASEGTGIIAGSAVRAIMEALGVRNVVAKCLGSRNYHNVVRATFNALESLETVEQVAARRSLDLDYVKKYYTKG